MSWNTMREADSESNPTVLRRATMPTIAGRPEPDVNANLLALESGGIPQASGGGDARRWSRAPIASGFVRGRP